MSEIIQDGKYVELSYSVSDEKSGQVLSNVEFPLGYVHGVNEVLAPDVHDELAGRCAGEIIELPIDGNAIYGPRDETLVFTDRLENVPEQYRELGTQIMMENENGEPREFYVTRMDERSLTVDGNHPLAGRALIFRLEVLLVRDASDEEIEAGGALETDISNDPALQAHLKHAKVLH